MEARPGQAQSAGLSAGSGWAETLSSQETAPEEAGPLLLLHCDLNSVAAPLWAVPFLKSQVCLVIYCGLSALLTIHKQLSVKQSVHDGPAHRSTTHYPRSHHPLAG